jgi:hypothetical protein
MSTDRGKGTDNNGYNNMTHTPSFVIAADDKNYKAPEAPTDFCSAPGIWDWQVNPHWHHVWAAFCKHDGEKKFRTNLKPTIDHAPG